MEHRARRPRADYGRGAAQVRRLRTRRGGGAAGPPAGHRGAESGHPQAARRDRAQGSAGHRTLDRAANRRLHWAAAGRRCRTDQSRGLARRLHRAVHRVGRAPSSPLPACWLGAGERKGWRSIPPAVDPGGLTPSRADGLACLGADPAAGTGASHRRAVHPRRRPLPRATGSGGSRSGPSAWAPPRCAPAGAGRGHRRTTRPSSRGQPISVVVGMRHLAIIACRHRPKPPVSQDPLRRRQRAAGWQRETGSSCPPSARSSPPPPRQDSR